MRMELLTHNKPSSPDPLHQEVTFKRPLAYTKMENLIKEMQDPEHGVPVRCQKVFLQQIPAAFAGYDVIEWLMERLSIEDSVEAIHLANLLCQHGYFFPVGDNRAFTVKDDSSLYRFQTPYYWPSQYPLMDSVDYAIYLAKRSLRNKQKHGLDEYEVEALTMLRKNLNQKWDFISMQADEQVRISKERKKVEKMVTDQQERAFWRVLRPPPGSTCCVETPPMYNHDFHAKEGVKQIRRTNLIEDLRAEVDLLRTSCIRTRIKVSQALESLASHCDSYCEHDPFLVPRQPSNPWISDDPCYWIINAPLIEIPTERRVKKWAISMEDLVLDPTGLREFTTYLKKEYCHENIRFWLAVRDLRFGPISLLRTKAQQIYNEFLSPGAPCEINIDMRTMEAVQKELNYLTPSRFTFDPAAEHVYTMLLKKDCYPRFIRSEQYKNLLANALQPINQKKRLDKFLSYLALGKKKSSTATPPIYPVGGVLTLPPANMGLGEMFKAADEAILIGTGNKVDLISASSVDTTDKLSVMADCPYRGDLAPEDRRDIDSNRNTLSQGSFDDVCPWESMEKIPEKEKAPSLSQSLASSSIGASTSASANKPSTSAVALMAAAGTSSGVSPAVGTTAPAATASTTSSTGVTASGGQAAPSLATATVPTGSQQGSIVSSKEQVSSAQTQQQKQDQTVRKASICSGSAQEKKSLPPQQTSVSSEGGATTTSSTSKESVIQASPSVPPSELTASTPGNSNNSSHRCSLPSEGSKDGVVAAVRRVSCISSNTQQQQHPTPQQSQQDHEGEVSPGSGANNYITEEHSSAQRDSENNKNSPRSSTGDTTCCLVPTSSTSSNTLGDNKKAPTGTGGTKDAAKDICPWDHENGSRPESITFVKTYSTLGYL